MKIKKNCIINNAVTLKLCVEMIYTTNVNYFHLIIKTFQMFNLLLGSYNKFVTDLIENYGIQAKNYLKI